MSFFSTRGMPSPRIPPQFEPWLHPKYIYIYLYYFPGLSISARSNYFANKGNQSKVQKDTSPINSICIEKTIQNIKCESVLSFLYVLIYFYFPYAEVQLQKLLFTHVYFGPDIVSLIKQKFHTGSMLLLKYNFEYFLEGALEYNYGI